ncbi:MAG TPA: hypothetical protein VFE65_00635 [Pseudonocardia sp.]|nr:hypothetical protein [Pseudonocardia sp.]
MGEAELARQQAALVAALVAGGPPPPGIDGRHFAAAHAALRGKRAGEVARTWPLLAAGLGARWPGLFGDWAARRPTNGSLRDGWDFARELASEGRLPALGCAELDAREVALRYDGKRAPRPRRVPTSRVRPGLFTVGNHRWIRQFGG